jgi:serine/threonine protein kinase
LETSAYLLLLLEFVPGQDLFYFLEQARDHYDVDPTADPALTHTPPTPGLLSSLHPSQLLSHKRLRLIASMFAQMCEAVAACHDASVFHRDIKPENFIVTDGWTFNQDGIRERKVIVKLSDFGLSTCDAVSSDMDCGSAPYMSYGTLPSHSPRLSHALSRCLLHRVQEQRGSLVQASCRRCMVTGYCSDQYVRTAYHVLLMIHSFLVLLFGIFA